jgi:hypothetical protein
VRRGLIWGSAALLLLCSACGSGRNDDEQRDTAVQPVVTGTPASAVPVTPLFPGEPPASQETARLDQLFAGATLPQRVDVFGRRDIPNEAIEKDAPDVGQRFREYGRVTGTYYVLSVNGMQRMTLSINRYGSRDGAAKEFGFGRGNPTPEDRLDAAGLGDDYSAHRASLGEGGGATSLYLVSFTRGCYYVVIADFPPGGADSPPDVALAVAHSVDDQLNAAATGGGSPGCDAAG